MALLVAELALFRPSMDARTVRLLPQLDLGYLVAAIAIIVTGLLRLFFFAKGAAFYAESEMFWIKMMLFVVVGLLSIPPTRLFMANRKTGSESGVELPAARFRHIRSHMLAELGVFALMPLAATLMARGLSL